MSEYTIPIANSTEQITISVEEYKKLLKTQVATEAFIDFVKASKYAPHKEDCARFLGFEIQEENNAGD